MSTSRVRAALLFSIATTALAQQRQPPPPLEPIAALPPLGLEMSAEITPDWMPDPSQGHIRVDITVTNKAGKTVPGLSEMDFTFLDNDRRQKIVTYQAFEAAIFQPPNEPAAKMPGRRRTSPGSKPLSGIVSSNVFHPAT